MTKDKDQYERFLKAAKEVGADKMTEDELRDGIKKLGRAKPMTAEEIKEVVKKIGRKKGGAAS